MNEVDTQKVISEINQEINRIELYRRQLDKHAGMVALWQGQQKIRRQEFDEKAEYVSQVEAYIKNLEIKRMEQKMLVLEAVGEENKFRLKRAYKEMEKKLSFEKDVVYDMYSVIKEQLYDAKERLNEAEHLTHQYQESFRLHFEKLMMHLGAVKNLLIKAEAMGFKTDVKVPKSSGIVYKNNDGEIIIKDVVLKPVCLTEDGTIIENNDMQEERE